MKLAQAKARHAELAEQIQAHDYAYYVLAKPVIGDREYDQLCRELLDLEKQFPELATPDSPSQRIQKTVRYRTRSAAGNKIHQLNPSRHIGRR